MIEKLKTIYRLGDLLWLHISYNHINGTVSLTDTNHGKEIEIVCCKDNVNQINEMIHMLQHIRDEYLNP